MSPHTKGDRRRIALLESLDSYLQESPFDSINIADISRRAGVTRSAFYFYFESKAAAVAALMQDVHEEMIDVSTRLLDTSVPRGPRLDGFIEALFDWAERHQHLYVAMLEARGSNESVRELWESDLASFVELVASMIEAERAAGRAPAGPDATAVATMLLELNDRALEHLSRAAPPSRVDLAASVAMIWRHAIYGTVDEGV